MENNKAELNMRYTASELKKRLENEIPVMKADLVLLTKVAPGFSPMVVHNISLCVPERVYLFLEPTLRLYKAALPNRKSKFFGLIKQERTEDEKQMEKRIDFIEDLISREHALYNEQLEDAKADIKAEKKAFKDEQAAAAKEGRTLAERKITPLSERIEHFRHVEVDVYEFIFPLVSLANRGVIELDDSFVDEYSRMRELAIKIYEEFIPKREKALETCNQILASATE